MRDACPCSRCRGPADDTERALHAAVRALRDYVEPARWPFFCSQLDQVALFGAIDDVRLSAICEVDAAAIAQQRSVEWEYAAAKEARLHQLAGDAETRSRLLDAWQRRLAWRSALTEPATGFNDLRLNCYGRSLLVRVPASLESYLVLFEVFLAEPYRELPPVKRIYDLGAHVGLAALYLHALQPRAELICVEPVAAAAELVEHNLSRNGVPHQVLHCAIGAGNDPIVFNVCPAATSLSARHALSDLAGRPLGALTSAPTRVECRAFADVVTGSDYGIKIDIEGAEHDLRAAPQVVASARWLVGELHLGPAIVPVERASELPRLLAQHGLLELDGPGVFGNSVTYAFRCLRPTRLFAR